MGKITGTCHCGAVAISVPSLPEKLVSCNCSICSRTGWLGAYYHPNDVTVDAKNDGMAGYVQGDRAITFWRCRHCGNATHWTALTAPEDRMGVNVRIFDRKLWQDVPLEQVDGASW
ncbi:GFA family protein [Sphingorhabdus sp. Alg239-R122]|uniref:GFA family protein n=1 Tax=Sphingorhabdus sp. Alg239-R122 TaxID=2305989 RepID=UPI0013D9A584|nr:GFA family protein [Sphingorhabdus sp. Alg239-R122]